MRPRKYHVTLTDEEYDKLIGLTRKGTASAQKNAEILLKLDENHNEKPWTVKEIVDAYHTNCSTVCAVAQRFFEEGLESALNRKKQLNRHHKITGEVEADMIAIAFHYLCSPRYGAVSWMPILFLSSRKSSKDSRVQSA